MKTKKISITLKNKLTQKYCSPKNENISSYTCFTKPILNKIGNSINEKENNTIIKLSYNKKTIWNQIKNYFQKNCSNEWCWINQEVVKRLKDDEVNTSFRTEMPESWYQNDREWLSTIDIENVLEQYQIKHKEFLTIGPVPIDFDSPHQMGGCVVDELCHIKLEQLLKNNKTKLGIVFNLDKHNQPGSHWVALYTDINKQLVRYFDSYGSIPPKEVQNLMNRLKKQIDTIKKNNKTTIKHNKTRHQYKDSECGVYSMMFIINMLEGGRFDEITKNVVLDDKIHSNRYKLYRPNSSIIENNNI